MSIRSIGNPYGSLRPAAPSPISGTGKTAPADPAAAVPSTAQTPSRAAGPRRDSVAISDRGRALASDGAAGTSAAPGLSPERLTELRTKVLEGAYNQTHVVDQVAKRLLSSGDV